MCSAKNCTVGQYSTYDHVQGMLAGRVEGSSVGSWQPSNCALEETWRYAYLNWKLLEGWTEVLLDV